MTRIVANLQPVEKSGYILTDDKAPVELLGISDIDKMIFAEINYYKDKIKGKSLSELIKAFKSGNLF